MNCPSSIALRPSFPLHGATTTVYDRFRRACSRAAFARFIEASLFCLRVDTSLTPERAAFFWRRVAWSFFCMAAYCVSICSSCISVAAFFSTRFLYLCMSFSSFARFTSISAIEASYTVADVCVVFRVASMTLAPPRASCRAASASITFMRYSRSSRMSRVSPLFTCWCSWKHTRLI